MPLHIGERLDDHGGAESTNSESGGDHNVALPSSLASGSSVSNEENDSPDSQAQPISIHI